MSLTKIFNWLLLLFVPLLTVSIIFYSLISTNNICLLCDNTKTFYSETTIISDVIHLTLDFKQPAYLGTYQSIPGTNYNYVCSMEVTASTFNRGERTLPDRKIESTFRIYDNAITYKKYVGYVSFEYWNGIVSNIESSDYVSNNAEVQAAIANVKNNLNTFLESANNDSKRAFGRIGLDSNYLDFAKEYVEDAYKVQGFTPLTIVGITLGLAGFLVTIFLDLRLLIKKGHKETVIGILVSLGVLGIAAAIIAIVTSLGLWPFFIGLAIGIVALDIIFCLFGLSR